MFKQLGLGMIALIAVGCGSDDATTPPATQASAACEALAQAWCTKAEACGTYDSQVTYGPKETCVPLKAMECSQNLRGNGVQTTDANLQACAAAIGAMQCSYGSSVLPAECTYPAGTLALDASCTSNLQCQSSRCTGSVTFCGKCTDPVFRAESDSCDLVQGIQCKAGLYCSMTDDVCKKLMPKGSTCELGGCESPLLCVDKLCAEPRKNGEPCTSLFDCGEGTCNVPAGKCEAINIADEGGSCWIHRRFRVGGRGLRRATRQC